jgi:hypothetical protein
MLIVGRRWNVAINSLTKLANVHRNEAARLRYDSGTPLDILGPFQLSVFFNDALYIRGYMIRM